MTQRDRVLHLLRQARNRGVTTGEFIEARIPRFSARIEELRDEGHNIATERTRGGARYTLTSTPEAGAVTSPAAPASGADTLFDAPAPAVSAITGRAIEVGA